MFAAASMTLGFLGLAVFAWRLLAYRPWWSEYVARTTTGLLAIAGLIFGYSALAGISKRRATIALLVISSPLLLLVCSYLSIGLFRSRVVFDYMWLCSPFLAIAILILLFSVLATPQWKSWFGRKWKAASLATLGTLMGVFLAGSWWMETCAPVSTALSNACASNLKRLGDTMKAYAEENQGCYPDPNRWCDLLLQHTDTDRHQFMCSGVKWRWRRQVLPWPVPKNERCYYAMNPNCEPNSPDDTVLLFETAGGWNISGGPELMVAGNHRGSGCSVLVNGGYLPVVRPEEFKKLNWGIEEEDK